MRLAENFQEVEELDRQDMSRLTLEERVSAVEQLRRTWFGEAPAANKRASGRDKDLRDVAMLEYLSPPPASPARMRRVREPPK